MPVIGGGDGDGVDGGIFEHLADIDESLRPGQAELLDILQARRHDVLVDVHHRGEFRAGGVLHFLDVIEAAATQTDHGDAHPVVRAQHSLRHQQRRPGGGFQNIPAIETR